MLPMFVQNGRRNITCILAVYINDVLLTRNEKEINQTISLIKKTCRNQGFRRCKIHHRY